MLTDLSHVFRLENVKPLTDCSSEQVSKQLPIAGLQGTFSKTQMPCRYWLSLTGLEIVSEVRDVRGSDVIYQVKILSKYLLVNQVTHERLT